ncbi:protein starmaker-like [Myzus persicae]|uniref:protein starmaker-like n=1 Tax=Myzus persicae TaxID=13164 RepID=UPI000B933FC8|nr:protein starmaker-like [Myzus persicae]
MKTTAFKIFASCVAIVCLASSPVTRAAPALKLVSGTSENPIVQKPGIKDKNVVGLNFVELKPHHSKLTANEVVQKLTMAVYESMVSQKMHRQRRSYDPEVENRLRKELEGEKSSVSVDSKEAVPVLPGPLNEHSKQIHYSRSNEIEDSQQSNEVQNPQSDEVQNSQSNEVQNSQSNEVQNSQSDEVQNSQSDEVQNSQSNEVQNSQSDEVQNSQSDEVQNSQLDEDYEQSDDVYKYRKPFDSQESYESEGSNDPDENSNDSASTNDDKEERTTLKPIPLQRTTT